MQLQDLLGELRGAGTAALEVFLLLEQGLRSGQGAGRTADGHRSAQPVQPLMGIRQPLEPLGAAQAEGRGQRVLRQGARGAQSVAVALGQSGQRGPRLGQGVIEMLEGLAQHQHQGGVQNVLTGQPAVHCADGLRVDLPHRCAQIREHGDHRVPAQLAALGEIRQVEAAIEHLVREDVGRRLRGAVRDEPELRLGRDPSGLRSHQAAQHLSITGESPGPMGSGDEQTVVGVLCCHASRRRPVVAML